jgi:membrane protein DedA with SNARE-associated domain
LEEFFKQLAETYGLPLLWLGLLIAGLGVPIPEDIFIITGGVLTHRSQSSILLALFVLYTGVMVGDTIVYHLGARYGEAVLRRKFIARLMTPARVERVRRYYAKYGAVTVLIARNLAGIRFPTFLMAGVSKMGFGRFFFWDSLSALVSVPLWFWLGYTASAHLDQIRSWIAWVIGGLVLLFIIFHFRHDLGRAFGRRPPERPESDAVPPPETPAP